MPEEEMIETWFGKWIVTRILNCSWEQLKDIFYNQPKVIDAFEQACKKVASEHSDITTVYSLKALDTPPQINQDISLLNRLKEFTDNGKIPKQDELIAILFELWEKRKADLSASEAADFFKLKEDEARIIIEKFAKVFHQKLTLIEDIRDPYIIQTLDKISNNEESESIDGLYNLSDNAPNIQGVRALIFQSKTYGTSSTPYIAKDQKLLTEIKEKLLEDNFFTIYGNSGRGKTFFVFEMVSTLIDNFQSILYYSPQFNISQDSDSDILRTIKVYSKNKTILFIIDDSHLVMDQFKIDLFYLFKTSSNISLLLISRFRESTIIPSEYLHDRYIKNFNSIAENSYCQILKIFSKKHDVKLTNNITEQLRHETDGGNLTFLTLLLLSWRELLRKNENFVFEISKIRGHANSKFLEFYDSKHSDNWKYINHIVSALFQYEVRIDKHYLSSDNHFLFNYGLESYLKDKLIHNKRVREEQNRLFYVFMDFSEGEEINMMRHAAEFRFYLEAYNKNLSFDGKNYLDRIDFTKYVFENYILFNPCNIEEVIKRINSNTSKEEKKSIFSHLSSNQMVRELIRKYRSNILKQNA